ncbi:MAG TPA: CdaR family protein [Chloroflexota bacterium]|nr:CdaR family protein [Chloroflexota bacterium]
MPSLAGIDLVRGLWALLLSLALWLVVQTELNPERSDVFQLAIEARNVPTGLVVVNESDWPTVAVRMSAPNDVFAQIRPSELRATVDLSRATPGTARYPVQVPRPDPLVRTGDPNPNTVLVRLEQLTQKTVPVAARLEGNLPFGYRAGTPTVDPRTLTVAGPASFVQRIESAAVEIRLDAVTSDLDTSLPAVLLNAQGERVPSTAPGVDVQPPTLHVQLPITQQVGYKEVGVHPVLRGTVAPGYWVEQVSVDPAVVTVIGEPQPLGAVESLDTEPIDLSGATGPITRQVSVLPPAGVTLARAEPLSVTVQVSALSLRQTLPVPVSVQGVGSDLFVASDVPIVNVTASGPADQGLSASDVRATVDASGLGEGTATLPVHVTLPDRYQLEQVSPASVRVVLQAANSAGPTATAAPTALPTAEPTSAPPTEPPPAATEAAPIPLATATAPPATPTPSPTAPATPTASATGTRTPTPTPRATATPVRR